MAFEILSKGRIKDFRAVSAEIKRKTLEFIGELGQAEAGLQVMEENWNPEAQRGIIRVNNRYLDHAKASLALVARIKGEEALVRGLGVSGTLKKAKKEYIAM
ncbi:MAG: Rpp14/Pop5 family protein [Candidatus Woesearchaeota archaeon]